MRKGTQAHVHECTRKSTLLLTPSTRRLTTHCVLKGGGANNPKGTLQKPKWHPKTKVRPVQFGALLAAAKQFLVDVSDFFFFLLGGGRGRGVRGARKGWRVVFNWKSQEGGVPQERGGGGAEGPGGCLREFLGGGGGAKYFFSGLKFPPRVVYQTPVAAQNRTELRGSFLVLSQGKATKFVRTRGSSKLTRFRNTENLVNPFVWTWTWLKRVQQKALREKKELVTPSKWCLETQKPW